VLSYDPLGRLAFIDSASDSAFAYDGLAMIAEYDGAGTMLARYVHGPGIDQPLVRYDGSGTTNKQSLHADERGSITALSYGSPYAPTINRYDEYGKPQATNIGRFQYTGQMWLGEAGIYHYKARTYSPTFGGRFLQTDPIGYQGGPNLYAYVSKDPINLIDPFGLDEQCGQVTGSRLMKCGEDYYDALRDIGYDVEQVTVITFTITSASLASGALSGSIIIPGSSMSPTLRQMLHDEDVRNEVVRAWNLSGAVGPRSGKNEYGFWVTQFGSDFRAGPMIAGEGAWIYRARDAWTPGATIWFHVHPYFPGEAAGVTSLGLSGGDYSIAADFDALVVAMSHRPRGSPLIFGWWEYDCRFGRC
jgi:RHS repeat-associated protein